MKTRRWDIDTNISKKIILHIFQNGFQKEIFEVHNYGMEVIISTLIDVGMIIGFIMTIL